MTKLNSRGHEVLSPKPKEVTAKISRPLSILDHQRIAVARARLDDAARIRTADDLAVDLFDFSYEEKFNYYDFPIRTRYEIEDSVPDVYTPAPPPAEAAKEPAEVKEAPKE